MTDTDDLEGGGFDVDDWIRLKPFNARVASLADVQAREAIFALEDTTAPSVMAMDLPQPLIWWDDDGGKAAVAVQAETHISPEGEPMDVLGLILPDGEAVVALLDDVDLVDDTDPTWRKFVDDAIVDPG